MSAALLLAAAVLSGCAEEVEDEGPSVRVGVGSTAEQRVLAALTVAALEDAGYAPTLTTDLGSTVGLRRAMLRGEVDVIWDYTGAAWGVGLRQQNPPAGAAESYERVREEDADRGLVWLPPTGADATLALFVRAEDRPPPPAPAGLEWLSGHLSVTGAPLCVDPDFQVRSGGLNELATVYPMDLNRVEVVPAAEDEAIALTAEGSCFAGMATATSGEAAAAGLVPVGDELGAFPAFVVAPVVAQGALESEPDVAEALGQITARLDTATLAQLNATAGSASEPADLQALAEEFLDQASTRDT